MSWKASAFVKEITENITQVEKLVLLILADYHHTKEQASWPSVRLLAEECLMTERSLYRIISRLEEKQFLIIETESGKKNRYVFVGLDTPDFKTGVLTRQPLTGTTHTPDTTPDPGGNAIRKEPVLEPENRLVLSPPSSEDVLPTKKPTDSRYTEFVEIISTGYKQKRWPFAWTARDGAQMKALLKSYPALDATKFKLWMKNYFRSEGVVKGDVPYAYLAKLPRYWNGPLNEFNKPSVKSETAATVEEVNRIYAD